MRVGEKKSEMRDGVKVERGAFSQEKKMKPSIGETRRKNNPKKRKIGGGIIKS